MALDFVTHTHPKYDDTVVLVFYSFASILLSLALCSAIGMFEHVVSPWICTLSLTHSHTHALNIAQSKVELSGVRTVGGVLVN